MSTGLSLVGLGDYKFLRQSHKLGAWRCLSVSIWRDCKDVFFFLELSPDEDVDDETYLEKCWEISTPSLAIFCSDWSKAYCHKFLNRCVHSAARRCFCRFDFSFSLQTLLMLRQSTEPEMLGSKVAASPRVCVTLFVCLYTCSTYALVPSSCRCNVGPAQFAWHWSQTPA